MDNKNKWNDAFDDFDSMMETQKGNSVPENQKTASEKTKNSKLYPYAKGRPSKKITITLYESEAVRQKGLEKGFTGGAVSHYINYLIDKDLGIIKE